MATTLKQMIAEHPGDFPAIGAPGRDWLDYAGLRALSETVRVALRDTGIGPQDRVAIVLPNGPEMATAFVTIAQAATTAPLNPAYREEEFGFYLDDLGARAIVLAADENGPALSAARRSGLAILRATVPAGAPAGVFALKPDAPGTREAEREAGDPGAEDEALILHTSGTTSRPKIVPLLQRNLAASACNIARSLDLTPADRCLNVMPLFHIHGLVAAVSASLHAGASIFCAPGFNAMSFFSTMREARPSWFTAVPTMHQAILSRAPRNAATIRDVPLRFLRSSSASLPGPVMQALADSFGAPVIEAYGMTEAAHQMCCNPFDRQKPGSVGVAAGPIVAIADETASRLSDGVGEVVIYRRQCHTRIRGQPGGECQELLRGRGTSLVPHRGPGHARRGRVPASDGTAEGDHQPRRREGVATGGGRRADGPSGDPAGGDLRPAAYETGRGGGSGGRAARGGKGF